LKKALLNAVAGNAVVIISEPNRRTAASELEAA
jgi:hypothetical protein